LVCGEETLKLTEPTGPVLIKRDYALSASDQTAYNMYQYFEVDNPSHINCYRASTLNYGTHLVFYSDVGLT
jgi:hypothetical protein